MTGKFKSLSKGKKFLVGTGALIAVFTIIGVLSPPPEQTGSKELVQSPAKVKSASSDNLEAQKPKAVITTKTEEQTEVIPFTSSIQNDPTLPVGQTAIAVAGVPGQRVITYAVTYTDGLETRRDIASDIIAKQPVNELKKIGTKPKPKVTTPTGNCDTNYTGCVPIASDVDCAGGSGNGPAYVRGPVRVVGSDIYKLDADGDGVACQS